MKSINFGFPYVDTLKILEKFGPGAVFYGHASEADLDDLHQLLGHRPESWFDGEAELERFVLADADTGRHDEELVQLFHKRNLRAQMLLGPEGSAMARHLRIQMFRD